MSSTSSLVGFYVDLGKVLPEYVHGSTTTTYENAITLQFEWSRGTGMYSKNSMQYYMHADHGLRPALKGNSNQAVQMTTRPSTPLAMTIC